jgi:pimeloyl-ACP methyl ester carboxylesterase
MGVRSARREVFKSLARLRWFGVAGMVVAERLVWKSAAQVTKYLTDEEYRRKIQKTVRDLVGPETEVIIGHSLGSVIAYEVAQQLEHPLRLLVTLGSPLGLGTVIYPRLRPQPPGFPCKVKRWVNVADRGDLIAAEPDLTRMFSQGVPSGARFEGGYTVENGAQPHSAVFYLTKAKTGRPIGEILAVSP